MRHRCRGLRADRRLSWSRRPRSQPPGPRDGAGFSGLRCRRPTHPRGKDNDISGVGLWVGRSGQVSRVIDAVLEGGKLGLRSRASASGLWAIRTVATPRLQSSVPHRVSSAAVARCHCIPTTASSAPTVVRPLGKPPARSATSRAPLRGYGLSCLWRRTLRASPTPRWQSRRSHACLCCRER
jgi:hypothetical protein